MRKACPGYPPISDYALIGDCHTAALVAKNGSIDWYCPERFDGPSVFGALLDTKKGGRFRVAPTGEHATTRRYLGRTNILETLHSSVSSQVRVVDFMPVHRRDPSNRGHDVGSSRRVLRLIEGLKGSTEVEIHFDPRFDYGRARTELEVHGGIAIASAPGRLMSLGAAQGPLDFYAVADGGLRARLIVGEGSRHWLVLTGCDDPDRAVELPGEDQCETYLTRTKEYWTTWARRCTYSGPYEEEVVRSALTLKLLTYEPTGAIIAAPTTSLPEDLGGKRNWDYRYAWTRDSAMILSALMTIGYEEEAADFFEWLQTVHHESHDRDIQVLYGIDGRRDTTEEVLDHWEGYCASEPVRIGNAAAGQTQLDILGEVLSAAYLYFGSGIGRRSDASAPDANRERVLREDWPLLSGVVEQAATSWNKTDNGIWEMRGLPRHFVYSRLMCWAALDLGIRLSEEHGLAAPLSRWKSVRKKIRDSILEEGFDDRIGAFVQAVGDTALDASALLIPRVGLLAATDPRMRSTIETVREALEENGLLYRYRSSDGLSGTEATFTTCTFWLVDALARAGSVEEARRVFEVVSGYQNDVGLFAEEIDPENGMLLGNFPQGFSHMALINSALTLVRNAQ